MGLRPDIIKRLIDRFSRRSDLFTDFRQFATYDTCIRPERPDKPSVYRREYLGYTDNPEKRDFLSGTFFKATALVAT